tara:strand:+ start:127 stop:714 length:588 start_codon:yes stop_codon:yes gene_type:complete
MMRQFTIFLIFLSFSYGVELKIGSVMPKKELKLIDTEGKSINLNSIKGPEATLVVFSCNTCPWVIKWEDRYLEIAKNYTPKGVSMVAINSNVSRFDGDDSLEKMKKHASKMNYNFIYAQDPNAELAYAFGATKTPHIYLFDKNDILVYRGAIDDNARDANKVTEPFLANALDALLSKKKIKKTTSKALGCSIKYN